MTDKTQPEALRLANEFKLCNEYDSIPSITDIAKAEAELRRQHIRIAELEAELEAVGAGGVQALSAAPAGWELVPDAHNMTDEQAEAIAEVANCCGGTAYDIYRAALAASPTPPAEQPIGELVVTKTRDGQIVSVTRQDDEGRILSVIATSDPAEQSQPRYSHLHDADAVHGKRLSIYSKPPAEQQAITPEPGNSVSAQGAAITSESGAVYAELPEHVAEVVDPNTGEVTSMVNQLVGFGDYLFTVAQVRDFADRTHALRMEQAAPKAAPVKTCVCGEPQASGTVHRVDGPCYVAAPQQEAQEPSADVQSKIGSNTWDHFGDILPTLKAISRGDWYWGANTRCKYIEIRIDTRDGGCILYDSKRVRISPQQFAHQSHDLGKMDPWPAKNALGDTAPQPAPAPLSDDTERLREALQRIEGASMSMYATRSDMLEHCQDIARAALAAQGGE